MVGQIKKRESKRKGKRNQVERRKLFIFVEDRSEQSSTSSWEDRDAHARYLHSTATREWPCTPSPPGYCLEKRSAPPPLFIGGEGRCVGCTPSTYWWGKQGSDVTIDHKLPPASFSSPQPMTGLHASIISQAGVGFKTFW
jgi:hypothetical protein